MAWSVRSRFFAAAIFWAIIVVGVAFKSRALDLFLTVAAVPVLLLLSIEQVRIWRRGKDAGRGDKPRDGGDPIATRFRKWYYGD
jgi:hypothetical protein